MFGLFGKKKKEAGNTQEQSASSGNGSGKKVVITEQTLTHSEPNVGSPVDEVVNKGDVLEYVSETEGWVQIRLKSNKQVWVPNFECEVK